MISHVRGTLASAAPACVVTVGGVGLELQIPEKDRTLLAKSGGEVAFFTYLYVREDRMTLFGFLREEDRELFLKLIGVSGIGPRIGLAVLAEHSAARIIQAIRGGDHGFLCRVPGLGKKTAERVVVELKDKLAAMDVEIETEGPGSALREEAVLALASLGMPKVAARKALEKIDWSGVDESSLEAVVREALKHAGSL
ncbi:MAG: Holliday junction branch migration protein RuvA [Candidatus Latescibacterota bacterium]|nr:MAG: Holliday junction branch migration protein RuvA [Candidatus Latescibacterota bacterium]